MAGFGKRFNQSWKVSLLRGSDRCDTITHRRLSELYRELIKY